MKLDKLNNIKFSIKTGDGQFFYPLFTPTDSTLEFNSNTFDFIDVPKSLVERKQPKSQKYPLKFYFQGENVLDDVDAFFESSKDKRYWVVTHPYYGDIKGHPISISRNDENLYSTEINVDFLESLVYEYPKSNLYVKDNSLFKRDECLQKSNSAYTDRVKPQPEDGQNITKSNNLTAKSFENLQTNDTAINYNNSLAIANKSNDKLLTNPAFAIESAQLLMVKPSDYSNSVLARVNSYLTAFNYLLKPFKTKSDVLFFESQGANAISCLCYTSTNYTYGLDYTTINEIDFTVNSINKAYNLYINSLDSAIDSVYKIDGYSPSPSLQNDLHSLVMYTISNLYELVFEAQKERVVYLEKDSNIILLAHRYLGGATPENIETFKKVNNINLNELFLLKKGRKIKYYV